MNRRRFLHGVSLGLLAAPLPVEGIQVRVQGVIVFSTNRRRVIDLAMKNRLPAIYGLREYVNEGGLMFYGAALPDMHRRAAWYIDRILKGPSPRTSRSNSRRSSSWSSIGNGDGARPDASVVRPVPRRSTDRLTV